MRYRVIGQHHDILGPIVNCGLAIPSLNIRHILPFMLDTGAAVSMVSHYFALILNVDFSDSSRLRRTQPLGGIGGLIDSYLVEDASIAFFTEENYLATYSFNPWTFRITKVEHPDEAERERIIRQTPVNIIGRDLLLEQAIQFYYSRNGVVLEIEIS